MGSLNESPGANWYQYDLLIDSMRKLILASSSCLSVQVKQFHQTGPHRKSMNFFVDLKIERVYNIPDMSR